MVDNSYYTVEYLRELIDNYLESKEIFESFMNKVIEWHNENPIDRNTREEDHITPERVQLSKDLLEAQSTYFLYLDKLKEIKND